VSSLVPASALAVIEQVACAKESPLHVISPARWDLDPDGHEIALFVNKEGPTSFPACMPTKPNPLVLLVLHSLKAIKMFDIAWGSLAITSLAIPPLPSPQCCAFVERTKRWAHSTTIPVGTHVPVPRSLF